MMRSSAINHLDADAWHDAHAPQEACQNRSPPPSTTGSHRHLSLLGSLTGAIEAVELGADMCQQLLDTLVTAFLQGAVVSESY